MAPNLSMVIPIMGFNAMSNIRATEIMKAPTVGAKPTLSAYIGKYALITETIWVRASASATSMKATERTARLAGTPDSITTSPETDGS